MDTDNNEAAVATGSVGLDGGSETAPHTILGAVAHRFAHDPHHGLQVGHGTHCGNDLDRQSPACRGKLFSCRCARNSFLRHIVPASRKTAHYRVALPHGTARDSQRSRYGIPAYHDGGGGNVSRGGYRITAFTPTSDLFWIFLYCLLTAAAEECVFRGTIYRITERSLGSAAAITFSALLFGGAHIINPNASLWTSVAIAVEAGVLFGAAYAHCGNLWLPIGIHWAWNFTEGRIWGLPVSGSVRKTSLFQAETSGPELLTGGMFGPEASLTVVILCSLLSAYLIYGLYRKGRWIPFRRRR